MRKTTLLTLAFSSLLVLPAVAIRLGEQGGLGDVLSDFEQYSKDFQNYLQYNVQSNFGQQDYITPFALKNNSEPVLFNIPDPVAAGQEARDRIFDNFISNKFENNPVVNGARVSNEINRIVTRSAVTGVLGLKGQRRLAFKLNEAQESLENITQYAADADQGDLSNLVKGLTNDLCRAVSSGGGAGGGAGAGAAAAQISPLCQANVQLQIVKILAEQSKINAETLGQTVQTNQALQYSNLNLTNISQQVEETNRARRVDSSAEAARLLRTTSQIDLFGRKEEK
ncbi:hypothetical protein H6G76_01775 [Nostoc sp. FACHB-152]|uniref:hypothetical protein n=1 Tax=unclassified Nostoc TaxID=2593658 RepID=UPI001687AA78|nr:MULTISPECIES: hypothetical protein [unclassified Nostoc]MBD2445901.1 hypothetical protein [Nostoc sp. FACHB-152]MBD2467923.1 hypothetical protein [Nostoc sp. FACHB-145]